MLHSFLGGSDGATPLSYLTLVGSMLYGTTIDGGSGDRGTIYAMNLDGSGYRVVHRFQNADGTDPYSGLILSGNTLYGMASGGGANSGGTVFALVVPEPSAAWLAVAGGAIAWLSSMRMRRKGPRGATHGG